MKLDIHAIQTNSIIGNTNISFPFCYESTNKINPLLKGEYDEVKNYVKIIKDNNTFNSILIIESPTCLAIHHRKNNNFFSGIFLYKGFYKNIKNFFRNFKN